MASIVVIAALDTKGGEARLVRDYIAARGHRPVMVDTGVMGEPRLPPDVSAAEVARAGADVVIAHMGLTVGGSIGLDRAGGVAMRLEDTPARVQAIGEAAWAVNPAILLLSHGGPIATPEDAAYVQERTGAVGFVGASSMERLPVEIAIAETVRRFKRIPLGQVGGAAGRAAG